MVSDTISGAAPCWLFFAQYSTMLAVNVVVSLLMLATSTDQLLLDESAATDEFLEDFLVYPVQSTNIRKRDVTSQASHADHDAFVEEKLIQHSQALEQLLRMVTKTTSVTRRLVEHMSTTVEKPEMPEEVKVIVNGRRSYTSKNDTPERIESPLSRLGRIIPLYGNYVKNLAEKELSHNSEPQFTRRSADGKVESVPHITPTAKNPWCELSVLCKRTLKPICAFDDNFGYGRFYDLCHMFQVNCYWKYNFSIVKNCKPSV